MSELNAPSSELLVQIGMVSGEIRAMHQRFDQQAQSINEIRTSVAEQIKTHTDREDPRLAEIERRLAKIERLVWTAIGAVASLGTVIAVVQKVFITS